MKLLLLPGNSSKNREWIDRIASSMRTDSDEVNVQHYQHWEDGGNMKFGYEKKELATASSHTEVFGVFAKSVGIALAMETMIEHKLQPKAAVFCGTTKKSVRMLDVWQVPTLFIQETNDPFLHFDTLLEAVGTHESELFFVTEIPGNKHEYAQVETIVELSQNFYQQRIYDGGFK